MLVSELHLVSHTPGPAQWPALWLRLRRARIKYDEVEAACFMRLWGSVVRTAIDVCGGVALLLWLVLPLRHVSCDCRQS